MSSQTPICIFPRFRCRLEEVAHLVQPDVVLDIIRDDPDDNRVLECAATGEVDYIVSGDRHLLKLGSFGTLPIMTVRQFMEMAGIGA